MSKTTPKTLVSITLMLTAIIITTSASTAYAQEGEEPIPELVDGIPTTILIAAIAVLGIGLQTYKGMIGKRREEFDIHQLTFTFIVGVAASITLVGNAFQHISPSINGPELMMFIVQQILTIVGAKALTDIGKKTIEKSKRNTELVEPEPIDPEDDLPPGKNPTELKN